MSSRSTRARLSVCLIGRDEARHLPGCLETVRDWADEIILIDTGSTDGTPAIARRAGARVYPHPWDGDFSNARNAAMDRATGDWILFIDCDERLDYVSGRRLPRWTSNLSNDDAFQVRILTPATAGSDLHLISWSPRLVRRNAPVRFGGALHERLHRGGAPLEHAQGSDITLYHVGYSDPDRLRVRRRREIAIDPAEGGLLPPDPPACLKLANHYAVLGEFDKAEGLYRILLSQGETGHIRPLVYWNLAISSYRAGDSRAAFKELDRAADEFPILVGTHLVRAQILIDSGQPDEAAAQVDLLMEGAEERLSEYPDLSASIGYLLSLKGACVAAGGDLAAAAVLLEEALGRDQSLFTAHQQRADILAQIGAHDEALSGYLRAAALRPDLGSIRIKAGLLLEQMGRTEDGLAFVREAARLDPDAAPASRAIVNRIEGVTEPAEAPEATIEIAAAEAVEEPAHVALAEAPGAPAVEVAAAEAFDAPEAPVEGAAPEAVERPWTFQGSGGVEQAGEGDSPPEAPEQTADDLAAEVMDEASTDKLFSEALQAESPAEAEESIAAAALDDPTLVDSSAGAARRSESELVSSPSGMQITPDESDIEARNRQTAERLEDDLARRPGDHDLQFQLGLVYLSLGDPERAEPVLRAAIRPTGPGIAAERRAIALAHLARCALDRNDPAQASRDARSALALSPESVRARLVLASAAYRNHHFTEAGQEYRRILNSGQDLDAEGVSRVDVSRELGVCLYRAQKFDEAAEAFAFAVADRPRDALGRLFLGNALAHLGRFESAYKAFREAVDIDPELTDARGNLEVMALELGYRHYDAGRPADALELVPEWTRHTELLFLKAISQHAIDDIAAARNTLEFLNSIDGSFAEAHWNLALVCRAMGDREAARVALTRFRQLAPGDKRAQALEEALQISRS